MCTRVRIHCVVHGHRNWWCNTYAARACCRLCTCMGGGEGGNDSIDERIYSLFLRLQYLSRFTTTTTTTTIIGHLSLRSYGVSPTDTSHPLNDHNPRKNRRQTSTKHVFCVAGYGVGGGRAANWKNHGGLIGPTTVTMNGADCRRRYYIYITSYHVRCIRR